MSVPPNILTSNVWEIELLCIPVYIWNFSLKILAVLIDV